MEKSGFGYKCTVEEFYRYMKNNGKENYQMLVQFRDDGGDYYGADEDIRFDIDDNTKTVTV